MKLAQAIRSVTTRVFPKSICSKCLGCALMIIINIYDVDIKDTILPLYFVCSGDNPEPLPEIHQITSEN